MSDHKDQGQQNLSAHNSDRGQDEQIYKVVIILTDYRTHLNTFK